MKATQTPLSTSPAHTPGLVATPDSGGTVGDPRAEADSGASANGVDTNADADADADTNPDSTSGGNADSDSDPFSSLKFDPPSSSSAESGNDSNNTLVWAQ